VAESQAMCVIIGHVAGGWSIIRGRLGRSAFAGPALHCRWTGRPISTAATIRAGRVQQSGAAQSEQARMPIGGLRPRLARSLSY
jgi:hypothetical protein